MAHATLEKEQSAPAEPLIRVKRVTEAKHSAPFLRLIDGKFINEQKYEKVIYVCVAHSGNGSIVCLL